MATTTPRLRDLVRTLRLLGWLWVALPLLAYVGVGFYRYQQIASETELRLDRSLRIAQEHALKVLDTNETLLARVIDAAGNDGADALRQRQFDLHRQMRAISANRPQIESIWLWDATGHAVATDRMSPPPPSLDISDRSYFRWHAGNGGGLFLSESLIGRTTGAKFFDMSRGRYDREGRFLGVASIAASPDYFEKVHGDLVADEPGLAITMLREDGHILSRWPQLAKAPASLAPDSPVMSRIRAGQTGGAAHGVSSVDGRKRLLFYIKVGDYPVYIGTGMDVAEIRERWAEEMAWLLAFGLPPLLGLFFVARSALRRTRESLAAAEELHAETAARRRVEEALVQAQKLEALGRLTGGVAHDFNNALMVISNNALLLKMKHPEAGGAQLDAIGRAVSSATKLTRQLLAFSRRQALLPQVVKLQDRMPGVRELLAPVLGSRVTLRIEVDEATHPICVDPAEFELALINLAINSRDALPHGGEFAVVARDAQAQDHAPLPSRGPLVMVEARDNGAGIPSAVLGKVFDPFFTTKPVGEGTGLGLSQVYALCQRAGGIATIESAVGHGTVVRLFFPAAVGQVVATGEPKPVVALELHLRVLLVEDNAEVAAPLREVLEAMGCEVHHESRAVAARDWLASRAQSELPDVMLSDVVMPGEMDGLRLAQLVRRKHPGLRIVLMTGYAEQLDTISRQGFDILPKPCAADALAEALAGRAHAAS